MSGCTSPLTDFLREGLYLCIVLHNILAIKKFTWSDLGVCPLRELEKIFDAPNAVSAIKRYNCVIYIATVRVHLQRMPARGDGADEVYNLPSKEVYELRKK